MKTEEKQEKSRKRALLALADEMELTDETTRSLALFDRRAETATAEQLRQALTDAFITIAHRQLRKDTRNAEKHVRGRSSASYFTASDLATIAKICAAAGVEPKGLKQ